MAGQRDNRDATQHVTRGRAPDTIPPFGGSDRRDEGNALVFPRRFVPPVNSNEFLLQDERDTVLNDNVKFTNTTAQFVIPEGFYGIARTVQFMTTGADATIAPLRFFVLLNDAAVPGYTSISIFQAGGVQSVVLDTWIRIPAGTTISAGYVAGAAAGKHVGMLIQGWYWSSGDGAS